MSDPGAAAAETEGGVRLTTTSDPAAAAPAELAGGEHITTTSDSVAAAPTTMSDPSLPPPGRPSRRAARA